MLLAWIEICGAEIEARRRLANRRARDPVYDPGCAIDDHDFLAGVIDKYLVAGRMVLPHGRRQAPLEPPE